MSDLGTFTPDNLIGGDKKLVTENIRIPSGTLFRGTVLGRIKTSTPTSGTADGGNTGNGTVTLVTGGKDTKKGTYTIVCVSAVTNGGTFNINDPDGKFVGQTTITGGAGGTGVFKSDELNLTLTDGAVDFAIGDKFTVAVTDGVPSTGTADGGNTGDGTLTSVEGRHALKVGAYSIECITAVLNGGVFKVLDPDGNMLANASVGVAYESDQLAFIINDGATDFVVGDSFAITTTISQRQCVPVDKTATDGSNEPYCVLSEDIDASGSAQQAIGYLEGQFNERALTLASGTDVEDVRDSMRDKGMIIVPSVPAGSL